MAGVSDSQHDFKVRKLLSKDYTDKLINKIVAIDNVVKRFLELEGQGNEFSTDHEHLQGRIVAVERWTHLINIVKDRCNNDDLSALKNLITSLKESKCQNNNEMAMGLQQLYYERETVIKVLSFLKEEKAKVEDLGIKIVKLSETIQGKESLITRLKEEIKHVKEGSAITESKLKIELKDKNKSIDKLEKELKKTNTKENMETDLDLKEKINLIDSKEKQIQLRENQKIRMQDVEEELKKTNENVSVIQQQNKEQNALIREQGEQLKLMMSMIQTLTSKGNKKP